VVVVENLQTRAAQAELQLSDVLHATQEVALPVAAGMAIIIMVFVPLLTLQGLEGKLFSPAALTIVFALGVSLLLSFTVIPALASLMLKSGAHHTPRMVTWLEQRYARVLNVALAHTRMVVGAAFALLVLAGVVFGLLGKSFMPTLDEGDIIMQVEKDPDITLETSLLQDMALQKKILAAVPEVKSMVTRVGADEIGLDAMGFQDSDGFMVLNPPSTWRFASKEALIDEIRRVLANEQNLNISFTQPIEMRTAEMLSGVRGDLAVKIFGNDPATLNQLAEQIVQVLQGLRGSEEVITVKTEGLQYVQVSIDRVAAGRLGLSVEQIQNDLRALIEGRPVGTVMVEGKRVPLIIRGPENLRLTPALFAQLQLPLADGQSIALSSLAKLEVSEGPVRIDRESSSRMAVVRANVRDRDLVGFVDEAKAAVAQQVQLPPGVRLAWGGQFENQQRAAARLMLVVPVVLALIVLILFITLGSLRQALLVLANVPFALVGGVLALAVAGEYVSVPASVGFIALMGMAVLNGLVLVTGFNQMLAQGMPMDQVVRAGAVRRLRPVLMTASITALGLIPLLLATGPGSEVQRPLAVVVMGGLMTSTLLTLLLLPKIFERLGAANSMGEAWHTLVQHTPWLSRWFTRSPS
jgi:cobalt-zinc-cadmium resistance protein CzcA